MCGLCGVLSPQLTNTQVIAFQDLMCVSTLRGDYGCGYAAVPRAKAPIEVIRAGWCTAAELAYSTDFIETKKTHLSMLMGHARQPTSGGFTDLDCHPHLSSNGKIIGCHNGTMVKVAGRKVGKNDNDSILMIESIAQNGLDDTLKRSQGSYSIVYIEKEKEKVHFVRNNQRPMHWAQVEDDNSVFWASETGFLDLVLRRLYDKKKVSIYTLQPGVVVSFPIRPLGKVGYSEYRRLDETKTTTSVPAVNPEKDTSRSMYATVPGYYLDYLDLEYLLNQGCCYCGSPATKLEYDKAHLTWTDKEEFICKSCMENDEFVRTYAQVNDTVIPFKKPN